MYKIIIWMNIPSHHQSAFFRELEKERDIDLEVRYFDRVFANRKSLGWVENHQLPLNQIFIDKSNLNDAIASVKQWKNRIHIIPGFSEPFLKKLVALLINNNVRWIHWSERSGKLLTIKLQYRYSLVSLIYPLFLFIKGYKSYANRINKKALGAFAIGDLAKKDFIKWGINKNKIKSLYYALDPLTESNESKLFEGKMVFMYTGSLIEHKGIAILLKAFAEIEDKRNWILVLVGKDISRGKYLDIVTKTGLSESVYFTGVVSSEKIGNYISSCDVFVLPTLFDGWGAVLNEAISLGKPIISTDQCGAAYHLLIDKKNGFRVPANSVSELKNAMNIYINDQELIRVHGEFSKELFEKYTPKKNAQLFVNNIKELLSEVDSYNF